MALPLDRQEDTFGVGRDFIKGIGLPTPRLEVLVLVTDDPEGIVRVNWLEPSGEVP